jgi:hypothetical protein
MLRTLTDRTISTAKPGAAQRKIFDAGRDSVAGLHLLIRPNGSKLWRLRYWLGGRERLLALGDYNAGVTLAAAREAARAAKRAVAEGVDPVAQRRADAIERERTKAATVAAVAADWLADGKWVPAVKRQYARYLERDILPALGPMPVSEVRRSDVAAVVKRAERQRRSTDAHGRPKVVGGTISARHVRTVIVSVLGEAMQRDLVDRNVARDVPVPGTRKGDAAHRSTPYRHFGLRDDDALRDLMVRVDTYGGDPTSIAATKLLMLLFTRPANSGARVGTSWPWGPMDSRSS